MTKEECLQKLDEVKSMGLLSAIVFYRSPVSDTVEERHIWANANSELLFWLSNTIRNYKQLEFPFCAYLNGCYYLSEGLLYDNKDN